jgi:four helix bundle protein
MFDFENLNVYQKARELNKEILTLIESLPDLKVHFRDQLSRASTSILLNIAVGSGKWSPRDKRNFYFQARGSSYECVSVLQIIRDINMIREDCYSEFYKRFEEISKMLTGMIKSQNK